LVLSGANTYTGTTAVNTGVLDVQHATALGTTAAGATVADGATLQVGGGAGNVAVGAELLTLGTSGGAGATLENVSGANSWGNVAITLAANATVVADTGSLDLTG